MLERTYRVRVGGQEWLVIDVWGDATLEVLVDLERDEWVSISYEYAPDVEEALATDQPVPMEKLTQYARCSCGMGHERDDKADTCWHAREVLTAYYKQHVLED